MPPQRILDIANLRLPPPRLKLGMRLTGVPYASRVVLAVAGQLIGKSPHHLSVYHRASSFFFPPETSGRAAQLQQLSKRESQPLCVTSTITSSSKTSSTDALSAGAADRDKERRDCLVSLRRDAESYQRMFPFTDFVDGCARGRSCIGLSKIHMRGVFATSFIPKGGVALCVRKFDFIDPIAMHLLVHSPRALPSLWRFYACHGGAAFPIPLTPNPTHFLNHSCDANLRAGHFYLRDSSAPLSDPLPPSRFMSDPRPWLECAAKYGEATADSECEAPLLRSLTQEEMYDFEKKEKINDDEKTSSQQQEKKKATTTTIEVDWNCFVAQRDIQPGEELTMDYARHIAPGYAGEFTSMAVSVSSPCNCGSENCTGDMYRSVPTRLDVVPSHEARMAAAAPYFSSGVAKTKEKKKKEQQSATTAENDEEEQEEDFESFQRSRRVDPHDDDLVRASFLQNRQELIEKMHQSLPRTMLWKSDVVINANSTCEFLTGVLAKTKQAPTMPGKGGAVSPMDLH